MGVSFGQTPKRTQIYLMENSCGNFIIVEISANGFRNEDFFFFFFNFMQFYQCFLLALLVLAFRHTSQSNASTRFLFNFNTLRNGPSLTY